MSSDGTMDMADCTDFPRLIISGAGGCAALLLFLSTRSSSRMDTRPQFSEKYIIIGIICGITYMVLMGIIRTLGR